MLQNHATLQQIRFSLLQELRKIYPESESSSILRLILDHAGYPSSVYLRDPDRVPGAATVAQINEFVSEIHRGKPIQYILGYTHFCDIKISVNESVLIPRPETEEMVHHIIAQSSRAPDCILDIGTGSGCIALALKHQFSQATVHGFELSQTALKVASENGLVTGLEVNWIEGDILNKFTWNTDSGYDLIVSNPPYVLNSERAMMKINVLEFEPDEALFVEDSNPLLFYSAIAVFSMEQLNDNGTVWVEINEQLGAETAYIFERAGFRHVTILKDIHDKERFIRVEK